MLIRVLIEKHTRSWFTLKEYSWRWFNRDRNWQGI